MKRNLILVGFPGTGKTQAGRLVATALGWEFVDSDEVITSRTGRTIEDIFALDGEPAFRAMERDALQSVCSGEKLVIGTGGGSFVEPENREMLLAAGLVVCLEAAPKVILQRLTSLPGTVVRPLLQAEDALQRITELKNARQECYDMAHITLNTNDLSLEQVASSLVDAFRAHAATTSSTRNDTDALADVHYS